MQTGPGTHPASYEMKIRVSYPGAKRQGRGVNHPPPPSVKVKEKVELYIYFLSLYIIFLARSNRSLLRLNYGLNGREIAVRLLAGARNFILSAPPSLLFNGRSFPEGKADGA